MLDHQSEEAAREYASALKLVEEKRLTDSERNIQTQWEENNRQIDLLRDNLRQAEQSYNLLQGQLLGMEGLHQKVTSAASKVERLEAAVARDQLESDAIHRLKTLFEECRESQISAIYQPIETRVLKWMRELDMPKYGSLHFNHQTEMEKLIRSDGAFEMKPEEESTGTVEQLAMLVRLALGSVLSDANNPAVAVFDDPLTHSDLRKLQRMRTILQQAAIGEPNARPSAGPLQILLFTCHPEWFQLEGARIINLNDPAILEHL
jgi:hypothetical protein